MSGIPFGKAILTLSECVSEGIATVRAAFRGDVGETVFAGATVESRDRWVGVNGDLERDLRRLGIPAYRGHAMSPYLEWTVDEKQAAEVLLKYWSINRAQRPGRDALPSLVAFIGEA